jgi:hypothetical protein
MRKFEVVELGSMSKGTRFYFVGDGRKKVYEMLSSKTDYRDNVAIRADGSDTIKRMKIYMHEHVGAIQAQPRVKCVFLSLPQDRQKQ